jgi:tetratricopeptide (TPR) repeat protein
MLMKFKLKLVASTALAVFATASSLLSQVINPEVVRLNKLAGERLSAHDRDSAEHQWLHALDIGASSEAKHTMATLRQNLGNLYVSENRYVDASKQLRLSYELLKAEYGEQHPKVAAALNRLGEVTCFQGHFAVARPMFERSLSTLNSQGSKNPELARVLTNMAATEWFLGNLSKAEKHLGHLTDVLESADRESPQLAVALQVRARIAEQEGDLHSAEASSQQALSILEKLGDPESLAGDLVIMGQQSLRQGDTKQAQARFDRALQLVRGASVEETPVGGALMSSLARCYQMQGRSREADSLFERAIGIDQRVLGPDHPNLLQAMRDYAQFLHATKRKKDAKRLEVYIHDHVSESARLNSEPNVVDFRKLLQEQKH